MVLINPHICAIINLLMGIYRGIVERSQGINHSEVESNDRIFTIPTAFTAAREPLALIAAGKLLRGEHPVTPWVFASFITDLEGVPGRLLDKYKPEWKLGSSEFGALADKYADTAAVLTVAGAALIAPRMPVVGRAAVLTAFGQEGVKAAWAVRKGLEHRKATGKNLNIPPSIEGKEAMAEKMTALGLAILASDLEKPAPRQAVSAAALGFAVVGSLRAERERDKYDQMADEMIIEARVAQLKQIVDAEQYLSNI
jgi:phosphatidylglycerophosphate synthase